MPIWAGALITLAAIALIAAGARWFTGKGGEVTSTPTMMAAAPTGTAPATEIPPTATATPETTASLFEIGSTQVSPVDEMVMVYVPEGEFLMGMPEEEHHEDAAPVHNVYLDAFWIDQTEVTNAQYQLCVDDGACSLPFSTIYLTREEYFENPQYHNYPVVNVDWNRAQSYCEWVGRRLPTEAEWEKAARGTDGRDYPWGDTLFAWANFCDVNCDKDHAPPNLDDGYAFQAPVGSYPSGASPYGAFDMAGNVSEWVADWYSEDYYSISPYENPQGPASGEIHVIRGGKYDSHYRDIMVQSRLGYWYLENGEEQQGFRCAVTNPILAYINREDITFQDDFSTRKGDWGQTSEFSYLTESVTDGVLSITDKLIHTDDSIIDGNKPGLTFPINGILDARDFSLGFDFSFQVTVSPQAKLGVHFRSPYDPDNAYDQNVGYAFMISKEGVWTLKSNDNEALIAQGEASLDPEFNTLQLIVLDQFLEVLINDELIYGTYDLEDSEVSGKFTEIALFAPEGAIFKLDNFKYWNLEGLEKLSVTP